MATERAIYLPYVFIESAAGFNSALFRYARTLVRGTAEREKGNTERLREYTDASLPLVEQQLQAAVPVYPEREKLPLSFGFERMREWLGPDHPLVRRILKQESPDTLAEQLVGGSRLADPAVRRALWEGGSAAVKASDDAMIKLALAVDEDARAVRKRYEDEVEAPVETASGKIARARFAALGTSVYPDATFTLRLNYGTVQGWNENGRPVEPFTRLETLFQRATGQAPFTVPESWQRRRAQLDAATPFNFATNNDIVGGNSGSPIIDAKGEIVGLASTATSTRSRLVLVRRAEEPRDRRPPGLHPRGAVEGLRREGAGDGDRREIGCPTLNRPNFAADQPSTVFTGLPRRPT